MNIQKISINNLIEADYNPRKNLQPNDEEYKKIKKSIEKFGYVEPVIVNTKDKILKIISGHQRIKVLKDLGYKEINCVLVNLNDSDEKTLNVALNKISGEWDNEKLYELLKDLEKDEFLLTGFDSQEFKDLEEEFNKSNNSSGDNGSGNGNNNENRYTDKVEIPDYVPKMDEAPPINDLVNVDKTNELINLVDNSNIKDDKLKEFLKLAASRFLVFNYENIAEYYCHQNKKTQEIMESLALIIIDIDKSIANGLVEFTEKINQLRENENESNIDDSLPFGKDDFN